MNYIDENSWFKPNMEIEISKELLKGAYDFKNKSRRITIRTPLEEKASYPELVHEGLLFLNKLKNKKIIKDFVEIEKRIFLDNNHEHPPVDMTCVDVTFNPQSLKRLLSESERSGYFNFIKSIALVINSFGDLKLAIINRDYKNPVLISKKSNKYWNIFCKIAEEEEVPFDLGVYKYFNSHKNNPIYKKTGLSLSHLLSRKTYGNGNVYISKSENIKLNIISEEQYKNRRKQYLNNLSKKN